MIHPQVQDLSDLPPHLGFRVGHSTIADGNMSYSYGEHAEVLAQREAFFAQQNVPKDRLIAFFTDHRELITDLDSYPFTDTQLAGSPHMTTDVIVTGIRNAGIFLGFADCVPYAVYDARQRLLAFAHIGWRSMALGLTGKVLRHLVAAHGSRPADLTAVIGPSIKRTSYRFMNPVQAQNPAWAPYLEVLDNGQTAIDLYGFCLAETLNAGLTPAQVYAAQVDTVVDPQLFSHYAATVLDRPEKQGRFFFYAFLEA